VQRAVKPVFAYGLVGGFLQESLRESDFEATKPESGAMESETYIIYKEP
jgi:hypothetical protein